MNQSGISNDTPDAIANALLDVVDDVEKFLSDYVKRLLIDGDNQPSQNWSGADDSTVADATWNRVESVNKSDMDFEQEKNRWEQQRILQESEIQLKFEQLTEAWLRLEEEQRLFLQIKDQHMSVPVGNGTNKSENPGVVTEEADSGCENQSRASAVLQFQRLRQEIGASRHCV